MALTDNILGFYSLNNVYTDTFGIQGALNPSSPAPAFFTPGKVGSHALAFHTYQGSGASSRAQLQDPDFGMDGFTAYTIAGWFYINSVAGSPGIISNWANTGGGVVQWLLWVDGTTLKFQVRDNTSTDRVASWGTAPTGVWTFFVAMYDSVADTVTLKIDDTGSTASAVITLPVLGGTDVVNFGSRNDNGAPLNGALDAVGFWSRTLTALEQTELYNAGNGLELTLPPLEDDAAVLAEWARRDYRAGDEVVSVLNDAEDLDSTFPAANTTEYRARLIDDPDGTPVEIEVTDWSEEPVASFTRAKILRETGGAIPTRMRLEIETRHVHEEVTYEALQMLTHDFDLEASEIGDDEFIGLLDDLEASDVYEAPDTGNYAVKIGSPFIGGTVEYRINAGAWTTVIIAGADAGTIMSVTAGDDLEFRHTQLGDGTTQTVLQVTPPTSTVGAYAVFIV